MPQREGINLGHAVKCIGELATYIIQNDRESFAEALTNNDDDTLSNFRAKQGVDKAALYRDIIHNWTTKNTENEIRVTFCVDICLYD